MKWGDLEGDVVAFVSEQLPTGDEDLRNYLQDLKCADEDLKQIRERNPDYDLPHMGAAYAMKFHMSRAFGIDCALDYIVKQLPQNMLVLDIHCGSGAGATALAYLASNTNHCVEVVGVEPSKQMRIAARNLVDKHNSRTKPLNEFVHSLDRGTLFSLENVRNADVVLLSHAIPHLESKESEDEWSSEIADVLSTLRKDGFVLIHSPANDAGRRRVVNTAINHIADDFRHRQFLLGDKYIRKPKPEKIIALRRTLDAEAKRLGVGPCFDQLKNEYGRLYSDPYYDTRIELNVLRRR